MEAMTAPQHQDVSFSGEQHESHWQPALRPDTEIPSDSETTPPAGKNPQTQSTRETPDVAVEGNSADEDDGRLDPAWGIKRTDSAHLWDGARRSPSFPSFPSSPFQTGSAITSPAAIEHPSEQIDRTDFSELLKPAQDNKDADLENTLDENNGMVMGMEEHGQLHEPDFVQDEQGRFEEGLPLISESNPSTSVESKNIASGIDAFADAGGEEEGSFFSQLQSQPEERDARASLDRKSTSDVLDALHFDRVKDGDHTAGSGSDLPDVVQSQMSVPEIDSVGILNTENKKEDVDAKWAAILDDEDEEFLVEDADDLLPDSEPGSPSSFIASLQDDSTIPTSSLANQPSSTMNDKTSRAPQVISNPYAPHQPSTATMNQFSVQAPSNVGFNRPGLAPIGSFQNQLQQSQAAPKAESFADQAKGGYKSPYDLPVDLSKPKRRPQGQRMISQSQQGVPPPPRSSSMSSQKQLQSPFTPSHPTFPATAASPAVTSPPSATRVTSAPVTQPGSARPPSSSSFFEELPVTSKPRPSSGRYTPLQNNSAAPPQLPPSSSPRLQAVSDSAASPPRKSDPLAQFQLRPPERFDPYGGGQMQPPTLSPAAPSNRYSPAPNAIPGAPRPTASPRYSPAPPSQPPAGPGRYASQPTPGPPASSSHAFQPRTSSPLAYQGKPIAEEAGHLMPPPPIPAPSQAQRASLDTLSPPRQRPSASVIPPPASNLIFSPPKASDVTSSPGFVPPRRSQTQSPSRQLPRSAIPSSVESSSNRPASAYGQPPVTRGFSHSDTVSMLRPVGRTRSLEPELDFEQPQDETQHDPLQRWKGAPIFKFGFGGQIISSYPRRTPRYKSGQTKPQIKPTAGEIKTRPSNDLALLPERVTTFPGPLKGKSKKKDLLTWMTTTISKLESEAPGMLGAGITVPDPRKCHEEKVMLWKIVRILVEHDGVLENKPEALKNLNMILSPEVHAIDEATASQYRGDTDLNGIYSPAGASVRSDSVDPQTVEALRKHLLKGERELAIWKAADNRLWSHALLIASTIEDPSFSLWKQVVQEFVRQEVKTIGNNSESLSALYEIFGGNVEESIDQLVPPSARAGLQMVSKVDSTGPTKNALDGLDRWKETLCLILNNRTRDHQRALATLGTLLSNYGRVEAAHICFLFARCPSIPYIFGGVDDPQAHVTLLGSDQKARPFSFHQDYDAVMLTEAYEYAVTTLAHTGVAPPMPYLAVYKFEFAQELADSGFKVEAQAYCDAIGSGITSKTKLSPYFHASLLMEVDDLAKRLKQVPVQSTSWMAKPSVEKATNSLLSKLSNFVAGDDSDAESKGSAADIGPFAKASGSPTLSRSGSQTDLYSSYPSATPAMPINAASSRYAPGGIASNRSSSDLTRGRPSLDSQRSPPTTSHGNEVRHSLYNPASAVNQFNQSPARSSGSYQPHGTSPSRSNYQATPPQSSYIPNVQSNYSLATPPESKSDAYQSLYMPSQAIDETSAPDNLVEQPAFGGYTPVVQSSQDGPISQLDDMTSVADPPQQSYGYGYEPPADTGYVPYQPEPESDNEGDKKSKPKKKSFMDDDGDDYSRVPSQPADSTATTADSAAAKKRANDEAADAAFRAAAEADAQRAKEQAAQKKASGSWLGGWFGGKKTENSLDADSKSSSSADAKVYKAKLGEAKMKLYYDKDLKKWVNPDDPDSMKTKSTPPPPPPGRSPAPPMSAGPPRTGGTPAPAMPISRSSTPASVAGSENIPASGISATLPPSVNAGLGLGGSPSTPLSGAGTPLPSAGGNAPPSRPVSNASSIDDLIGPATGARKGGKGARGAKKGRYVDVMAQ